MIRATDIHSLTDFQRNAKSLISEVKRTKNPIALTVNGRAEVVVQDADDYEKMQDELDHARTLALIREGIRDMEEGRTQPADEVFERMMAKYATKSGFR